VTNKYSGLDAAILATLSATTPMKFSTLINNKVIDHLSNEQAPNQTAAERILDRRLQALRRQNKVTFVSGHGAGWRLISTTIK
jgi:hypothetical protein